MSNVLSNDLIAQFAKAAVGNEEAKPDSTLRGTIKRVVYDETGENLQYVNVKMDGSDLETPVSAGSFAVGEFKEEDRVEVAVKNHELTITANMTHPSLGVITKGALRSEISQTADQIRLEVADTANKLESSITLTAKEIRSEVSSGLSGLDSKITQTAEEISQKISKNEEEFTEFKQTVEGWEFVDENGSIYIQDGAISWDKLDSGAKKKVTDAQSTANSAQSTANSAQSTANSAQSTANSASNTAANAQSTANSANSTAQTALTTVSGITITDFTGTYIDGSMIYSGSIYTDALHLGGLLTVYKTWDSSTPGGYLGYDSGFNSDTGIGIKDSLGKSQVVCTNNAARISWGGPTDGYTKFSQVVTESGYIYVKAGEAVVLGVGGTNLVALDNHSDHYSLRPHANILSSLSSYPMYLGNAAHKWSGLYATNGTIQTSDRNLKHDIEDLPDKYITLFDNLHPKRFKMNEGTSGRYHVGYIAQEVEDAMNLAGIDSTEFGGFVRNKDEDGNDICMLRYGEFDAIYAAKIKQLETRLIALEKGEQ